MATLSFTTTLETRVCVNCGIFFAMPKRLEEERQQDHREFYCPNGHAQHFTAETETERLRRERDILKQQMARKDDEIAAEKRRTDSVRRDLETEKRKVKRAEKRSAAGVCPCCNRQFVGLRLHVSRKHPGFVAEAIGENNVVKLKANR